MKIKPAKIKRINYPTLDEVLLSPDLLRKNIPLSWQKNRVLAGALSVFLLSGCNNESSSENPKQKTGYFLNSVKYQLDKIQEDIFVKNKMAPIFVHGDGSGAIGCMVMSFPVFISESEARKIILEEFKRNNIEFDTADCPSVKFKIKKGSYDSKNKIRKVSNVEVIHHMDGYNKKFNLAFDYISRKDNSNLEEESEVYSSVSSFSTKETAEFVRKGMVKADKFNGVVFYDPLESEEFIFSEEDTLKTKKKEEKTPQEKAKENLIAQVSDFIIWAKKEGIIK
jgi:hypothetical protein